MKADDPPITALLKDTVHDARELLRVEIELARSELRHELRSAVRFAVAFCVATVTVTLSLLALVLVQRLGGTIIKKELR